MRPVVAAQAEGEHLLTIMGGGGNAASRPGHRQQSSDAVFDLPGVIENVPGDAPDEVTRRP